MISIRSGGDLAYYWPRDGQDMAENRPDVGQNSSGVVELCDDGHKYLHYFIDDHPGLFDQRWQEDQS